MPGWPTTVNYGLRRWRILTSEVISEVVFVLAIEVMSESLEE
jgi:hypothetical protein